MEERKLAKISSAKFGTIEDHSYLFGMMLSFEGKGWGVGCGGRYTMNMNKDCNWKSESQKFEIMERIMRIAYDTMTTAKVNSIEELRGIPVEIILKNGAFQSFRILTEVL